VYTSDDTELPGVASGTDGLLYVGSASDLRARVVGLHFGEKGSGFSTLRRTIGALIREQFGLQAIQRSPGSKTYQFKFSEESERRLSSWMRSHLQLAVYEHEVVEEIESDLIRTLEPPLNLKGWSNPDRPRLLSLRKKCADEAASSN
jgi:hypothetical protein